MPAPPVSVRPNLPAAVEAFVRLALSCRNVVAVRLVGGLSSLVPPCGAPPGPSPATLAYHERERKWIRDRDERRKARLRLARPG